MFSAVPNRAQYRQNACFRDIVFKKSLCSSKSFQIVSEGVIFIKISVVLNSFIYVIMHDLKTLFLFVSLQFQIISNTIRMHALETLFSVLSLQFRIVSNTVRMHALETLFSIYSLQFRIVSNTVRILALETWFSKCSLK